MSQITQIKLEALNIASQMILKEIDLTGTDAQRKAKLTQFEADWKALTNASDLTGARFVGNYGGDLVIMAYSFANDEYEGICYGSTQQMCDRYTLQLGGSLTVTPLFSHLEMVFIGTGNTANELAANKTAIKAYVDNLVLLGVDIEQGFIIPISITGGEKGVISGAKGLDNYNGVICGFNRTYQITVSVSTGTTIVRRLQNSTDNELSTSHKEIVSAINEVNIIGKAVRAFGAIELKASDNAANKAALTAYKNILTNAGISTTNGYSVPVRITGNAQEYHGMLNIGTGALLSGIVTDVNETHHYPFNVNTTDGAITFDANNYFLEKTSNEVTEMLDAIKYSYTPVSLTATTSTNKTQLDLFLSKVPNAQVMHCTYKDVYAGTLHKIGTDWFGLLVKNTNNYEDAIQVKLQADGTLIEGTTSLAQVNAKLANIIG